MGNNTQWTSPSILNVNPMVSFSEINGKLLEAEEVKLSDEVLAKVTQRVPDIDAMLQQISLQSITYMSDGLKIKGYMALPKASGTYPCIIYNRGGSSKFGVPTGGRAASRLAPMAAWGYVVVSSNYRGSAGSEGQDEYGGADVNDVLSLIPLLDSLPETDPSRIGMVGVSRGGMMTCLALTRTERISGAIIKSGSFDLFKSAEKRPEMETHIYAELIPDYAQNKVHALTARSANLWPERLCKTTPILMLHGSSDWRVHPTESLDMASKLFECKHPFRFIFFEGGDHGLSEHTQEVTQQTQ